MGKIRQGILGGFSGKVANVVGSSWKGIAVMKSLPLSVANPRTAGQVTQRNKFANVVSLAVILLTGIIKPLWDRFAQRQSGFNAFISANIDLFDNETPTPFADLVISRGRIGAQPLTGLLNFANESMEVQWDSGQLPENALLTDQCFAVAYNVENDDWLIAQSSGSQPRSGSGITFIHDGKWADGETVHVYVAFRRVDGTVVSDTSYFTGTIPNV